VSLLAASAADFLDEIEGWTDADQDDALWVRCEQDKALFCAVFFPDRFALPFNQMHRAFLDRPKQRWTERTSPVKQADAAPRGGAKSTLESFASLIHDAVYGFEHYVCILSTTFDLSEDLVEDLHRAFIDGEANEDLHRVFGPFVVDGTKTDFVVKVPGWDPRGTRFKAFSFGSTIRGTKHVGVRPSKVVMDDSEHPDRVRSPDQRNKTADFLQKDILKAGDRFTVYRMIGTVLHGDAVLARVLSSPGWFSTKWRAVQVWPKRMDLWNVCKSLWEELDDPDRLETAQAFYAANKAAMDEGASVLWPEGESLWDLMVLLWSDGQAAFNSEKQNEPSDPDRQAFDIETFRRCKFDGTHVTNANGRRVRLKDCSVAFWLDPRASSEIKRNDYSALAMVARDSAGYRYVIRCDLKRDSPAQARARVWSLWEMYAHLRGAKWGYEDNGFAALNDEGWDREREARRMGGTAYNLTVKGYPSTTNKHDRILRLQPDIENGHMQFCDDLSPVLIEQFRDLGTGTHDDGPDAVERADWLLTEGRMPAVKHGGW
jgi:hypothetical protein